MKNILFLLLLLSSSLVNAQNKQSIELVWSATNTYSFGTYDVQIPHFTAQYFQYDEAEKSISAQVTVPQSAASDASSLIISDVIFETINSIGDLDPAAIPSKLVYKLQSNRAREMYYTTITISPIIKEAGIYKRIKSFAYNFNNSVGKSSADNAAPAILSNSVLSSGEWYRFYVEKSGVYKISKGFLKSLGMNVDGDPRNLKIYGNGGRMLPLANAIPYPNDLVENSIQVIGESDGVFNDNDYILFYAEGVDNWNAESQTHVNLYADKSYYYVTFKGGAGKRMNLLDPLDNAVVTKNFTKYNEYQYHEKDLINVVRVGRRWFGEQFNIENVQEFSFDFPQIDLSSLVEITVTTGAAAFTSTNFSVAANGQTVGTIGMLELVPGGDVELTTGAFNSTTAVAPAQNIKVKITFNNNGVPGSKGFLDYIILRATSNLSGYGKQFRFQVDESASSTGVGQYTISNANAIPEVWDITDIYNVGKLQNTGSIGTFSFKATLGELRKYIAVDASNYYAPSKDSQSLVVNQDLKGTILRTSQGQYLDVDYLIITPSFLSMSAEKLANFHRQHSNLNVKVVKLEDIYQEFSSGKQDIAGIRNFVKYVYQNASLPQRAVKYVNLFGDASFDYKNRIPNNNNIVPIYHSMFSYSAGESSFASDDFYALMDQNEGVISGNYGGIDIAVGRMLVSDVRQAEDMVQKVIDYHDPKSYGSWRNNIVLIADDADKVSDASLQQRQNQLSDRIYSEKPFINVNKILLDSYVQETSAGGKRYPEAREELFNNFEKGALVFNYLGHGGPEVLSGERIWEKTDGQNLQNKYKYPLFITITCDFSKFDDPYRPTAGEYTYWNPKGGAISMLTTIRAIGQSGAESFNDRLSEYLFGYGAGPATQTTIAEALRLAKNSNPSGSSNVVFYIGDPALMLALPQPKIKLTKVNDVSVAGNIEDLKALGPIKLTGVVTDQFDNLMTTYNGELSVNIFDKMIDRLTLNNDGNASPMPFKVLGETIFRGNATINSGQFEFSFVVPRDIRVPVGNGRISFYGKGAQNVQDKTGFDNTIKVGGINANAAVDVTGPTVKLYMNDQNFVSGGITNASPIFLAFLEDENGINTASGIGHDLIAILDGDESNPYVLNDYYETELDNFKKGKIKFPFRNLSVGLHTLTFKGWDVYNNPVTAEIQFVVVGDESITLTNVLNYPNPFVNYTQFWFTHNRPFEPLQVQVQVITVTGKVVWTTNQIITTEGFTSREISWDGRDDFGDRIGKGVYVYKLTVKSLVSNTQTEKYEKLVIL
ncbi:MAG: type IX secretion system sortase PorU [Flavobacterium sp.]